LLKSRNAVSRSVAAIIAILIIAVAAAAYITTLSQAPPTGVTTTTTSSTAAPLRIALIMEGPAQDKSWNQFHSETLQKLVQESQGKITSEFADNVNTADFVRVATDFANRGFDLIVGDSNNFQQGGLQVADSFPNTKFAIFGAFEFRPNLVGYTTWPHEGAYLAGYLGGLTTKTGKLGVVVAFKFASQLVYWNGFVAGAAAAAKERNTTITVSPAWTGTWTDPTKGAEAARAFFDNGVDYIAHDASGPGAGALQAAKEKNIPAVGAFVDESYVGPNVVTSVLFRFDGPLQAMLRDIRDGKFGGKSYDFTMRDGAIDLAPISSQIPQAIRDKVDAKKQGILQGLVRVPFVPDRELSGT
jgi:basic membrane protein A